MCNNGYQKKLGTEVKKYFAIEEAPILGYAC